MIFLEGLPETLTVNGMVYPLYTDYRAVLQYDRMLHSGEDSRVIYQALGMIYKEIPSDIEKAIQAVNWFVNCGREDKKSRPSNKVLGINQNQAFGFEEDELLIWSAFKFRFQIDLLEIDHLHWWLFRALLDDIGDDVRLSQIMQYRVIDTNMEGISKERKNFLNAMQRYYKIQEHQEERDEEFIKALLNGEDISKFLEK